MSDEQTDREAEREAEAERERQRLRHDYLKRAADERAEADKKAEPPLDKATAVWR